MELILFLLLAIKHAFVDIALQRHIKIPNKQIYLSKVAQIHYAQHGIMTFAVCLLFVGPLTALIAGALDWVAHWHIDHTKARINQHFGFNNQDHTFWYLVTIDQMLHFTTYWLIIVLI